MRATPCPSYATQHVKLTIATADTGRLIRAALWGLQEIAEKAGFPAEHIAYVTAYQDRSGAPFKKTMDALAWGSYAWFVSEPEGLVKLSLGAASL